MAVTLRLARHGAKGRPYYRIVATETRARRDGKFIEIVGTYHPIFDPPKITLKEDKIRKWISYGAGASMKVAALIKKAFPGLIEQRSENKLSKIRAARKKRKQRIAAKKK